MTLAIIEEHREKIEKKKSKSKMFSVNYLLEDIILNCSVNESCERQGETNESSGDPFSMLLSSSTITIIILYSHQK